MAELAEDIAEEWSEADRPPMNLKNTAVQEQYDRLVNRYAPNAQAHMEEAGKFAAAAKSKALTAAKWGLGGSAALGGGAYAAYKLNQFMPRWDGTATGTAGVMAVGGFTPFANAQLIPLDRRIG